MNEMYGFSGEVKAKYNAQTMELFTSVYNWLPLGHIINNKVMVCSLNPHPFSSELLALLPSSLVMLYQSSYPPPVAGGARWPLQPR